MGHHGVLPVLGRDSTRTLVSARWRIQDSVWATTDPRKAVDGVDIVVLAVPSQTLRVSLAQWAEFIPRDAAVVSLMKGVELGTTKRMSEVIGEVADVGLGRIAGGMFPVRGVSLRDRPVTPLKSEQAPRTTARAEPTLQPSSTPMTLWSPNKLAVNTVASRCAGVVCRRRTSRRCSRSATAAGHSPGSVLGST